MLWMFTGLPLAAIGCCFIVTEFADIPGKNFDTGGWLCAAGVMYLCASLLALSSRPWARRIAIAVWCPTLVGFPVFTILGVIAIRILLNDPELDQKIRQQIQTMSPTEIRQLIETKASAELDVPRDRFDAPMEAVLRVAPVAIDNFLDELQIDYGLPISSDDRQRDLSVNMILDLVASRIEKSQPTA